MSTLAANWTTPHLGYRDPQIAAGQDVVIVSTNGVIGFYDHGGSLLPAKKPAPGKPPPQWKNPISVSALFDPLKLSLLANVNLPAGVDPAVFGFDQFYDNRVIFDPYRKRFWIGALAINSNTKNEKLKLTPAQRSSRRTKFLVAVSITEDPRDGWHRYWWDAVPEDGVITSSVFQPGDSGDYPYIGIESKFLIQTNVIGNRDPNTGDETNRRYTLVNMLDADALAKGGLPQKIRVGQTVFGNVYAPVQAPDQSDFRNAIQPCIHLTSDATAQVFLISLFHDTNKTQYAEWNVVIWTRSPFDGTLVTRCVPIRPWGKAVPAPQASDQAAKIADLEGEKKGYQEDLQDAGPTQKPWLLSQIANINSQIAALTAYPLEFRTGTIFSATYSKGLIYLAFGDTASGADSIIDAMRVVRVPAFATTVNGLTDPEKGFIDRKLPDQIGTTYYGWPVLTATGNGDMVLAYIRTSPTSYPEVRYNIWPKNAPRPQPSHLLKAGEMRYADTPKEGTVGDLDMINIAPDPDATSVWIAHPYPFKATNPATASQNFRLVVGRVVP